MIIMAVDSAGRKVLCMPRQWQDRGTSPERTKVWMEPKSKTTEQKVPIIYYLSRNGQLEQPHFMEVPLSSPKGLYLKDVLNRLNILRGQGMANMYTWSSKRSYKNGFVWQDLSDNDFIYPCHGQEYVFKGSQLLETSLSFRSYETVSSISSTSNNSFDTSTSSIDSNIPTVIVRKKNQSWSSFDDLREYEVYKARAGGEFAAKASNAATQTEDKERQKRKGGEEVEECEGNDVTEMKGHEEVHLAFSKDGFGGLGSLEGSKKVDVRNLLLENDCPREKKKASKVLMQLISCGSRGIKDRL
ncbi:hypothetical protein ACB094_06G167200 [Castanea mollissima]